MLIPPVLVFCILPLRSMCIMFAYRSVFFVVGGFPRFHLSELCVFKTIVRTPSSKTFTTSCTLSFVYCAIARTCGPMATILFTLQCPSPHLALMSVSVGSINTSSIVPTQQLLFSIPQYFYRCFSLSPADVFCSFLCPFLHTPAPSPHQWRARACLSTYNLLAKIVCSEMVQNLPKERKVVVRTPRQDSYADKFRQNPIHFISDIRAFSDNKEGCFSARTAC